MITRLLALSLLLLPCFVRAAEITAGWKMSIEMFAPGFPEGTGLRKLEKAPGESAFFQAGDELWDVSKVREWPYQVGVRDEPLGSPAIDEKPWQGKWIVWNARSGMFVARGSWGDILAAQGGIRFAEQICVVRSTLELERPGKAVRSLTLVSRNAEEAKLSTGDMDLHVSAIHSDSLADLSVKGSWKGEKEGTRWELTSTVTTQDNFRHLLASQGSGESAWKLFVTTRYEGLDGTLRSESQWMEAAGKLRHWPMWNSLFGYSSRRPPESSLRRPLGKDCEVASLPVILEPRHELAVVEVPEALKGFAEGPVFDLKELLEKRLAEKGADFSGPGFFVGYDLLGSRILVIGDTPTVDLVEDLVDSLVDDEPVASLWISTNEASGGWGVSARSGEKVRLVRLDASGKEDLLFEIEPYSSSNYPDNRVMDLRLNADLVAGDVASGRVETAVTLEMGKPMEVARRTTAEGGEVAMEITGKMVPFGR